MKITSIAQSGFIIDTPIGIIAIDLWLNNPVNAKSISDIPKLDYVFVTHAHNDHGLLDSVELVKRDGAIFVSSYDIQKWAEKEHGIKIESPGSIGGSYTVGKLNVIQTHADHSSDIGNAVGFIIDIQGTKIFHMGDTGYYETLKTIGKMYNIDILMVPIGSRYTMGPMEASYAVSDLKPKVVIPMHYNTFPKIEQDPKEFILEVKRRKVHTDIKCLKPGEHFNYSQVV